MSNSAVSIIQSVANSNSLNAALALSEAELLCELVTTLAYEPNGQLAQRLNRLPLLVSSPLKRELERRLWRMSNSGALRTHGLRELIRLTLLKTGTHKLFIEDRNRLVEWVLSGLDRHASQHHLSEIDAVYAYEDQSEMTFRRARQKGIKCLYDLPSIFYKTRIEIERAESELFPELADSFRILQSPSWKLERKETEVELADHIFVASSINRNSLIEFGIDEEKISVVPYGSPVEYFSPKPKLDDVFRVLFVGRASPHKGIHYLLNAWKNLSLKNAELMLVGSNLMPACWFKEYQDICCHIPSVPHTSLNDYYSLGNVLVFPSLAEGFGLAITEAMACGIPVITTVNTAGPDIITDGVEGFIVPIRDETALQEKIEWCYENPKILAEMGESARKKAEQLTWGKYRHQLTEKILGILDHSFDSKSI